MPEIQVAIPKDVENLQLPEPTLLGFYQDDEDRVIWIEGEITDELFEEYKRILRWNAYDADHNIPTEQRKPIKIFIHSPGGNLEETLSFCGLIGLSKTPVYCTAAGWAYSAAGLILIAGHKRFAMPNSQCLIHSGSGGCAGSFEQAESQMANYKKIVADMRDFILSRTTIDSKFFKKKSTTEWYIDTQEMKQYGIVDTVVTDLSEIM